MNSDRLVTLNNRLPKLRHFMAALFVVAGMSQVAVGQETWTMQQFVNRKNEWGELAKKETPLSVEGRLISLTPQIARFDQCSLLFRVPKNKRFDGLKNKDQTLQVFGRLDVEKGKLFFRVNRFVAKPSDTDTFKKRFEKLEPQEPEQYYELARWAFRRGRFYKDKSLTASAMTVFEQALRLERAQLKDADFDALLGLMEKSKKLNIEGTLETELKFEAHYVKWQQLKNEGKKAGAKASLEALAKTIAESFPGAKRPLADSDLKLRKQFEEKPIETYKAVVANTRQREKLHRMLYGDIVVDAILLDATPDSQNAFEIAKMIETRLPERSELAAQYRNGELEFRLGRILVSTRQEILDLVRDLEKLDRSPDAIAVKQKWLDSKRQKLNLDNDRQAAELARDYVSLQRDEESAAEILLAAIQRQPSSKVLQQALKEIGYVRARSGRWTTADDEAALGDEGGENSMIQVGMTGTEVRKLLFSPTRITRIVTSGRVSEVWTYGNKGESRIIVYLARNRRGSGKIPPAHVISVVEN